MQKPRSLEGRNILLTGASRGLGRQIAVGLWNAGASLLLVGRSVDALRDLHLELVRIAGPDQQAVVFPADLGESAAQAQIVGAAKSVWKRLDGLVNNAALLGPVGKAWKTDWSGWQETIGVNLLAPIGLCRLCVPWMIAGGRGKIINLSGGGATGTRPNFSAYAVSKAGLVRFTEILADELKGQNIEVNSISPGIMYTDLVKTVIALGPEKAGQREYEQALRQQEAGNIANERAVELCVFLASSASDGITGKLISAQWDPWQKLQDHRADLDSTDIYTLRRIVPKDRGKDWGDV